MGNGSIKPEPDESLDQDQAQSKSTKTQDKETKREDIRDKYDLGENLGSGSFGQVREAKLITIPDRVRAVKIIEREDGDKDKSDFGNFAMFQREVALLQSVKHKNIVRFWDVYEDIHFLYVVMDLCRGGEVFSKLLELRRFTEANAATLCAQMLEAIDYIHSKSIMHRDIKPENFLLADDSPTAVVKMIDFGMATRFNHGQVFSEICGSPHYLAPELIGQKYDYRVDVWAFGISIYLMLYGHYPHDGPNTREIMTKVVTKPIKWQTKVKLTDATLQFLKKCLNPNPRKRITTKDALEHDFIITAQAPDQELEREDSLGRENLVECVRDAHRKITLSKKLVEAKAEQLRNEKLDEIQDKFESGIKMGARLGDTPQDEEFMSMPEHVRRSSKITTAPSKAIALAAKRAANNVSMMAVSAVRDKGKRTTPVSSAAKNTQDENAAKAAAKNPADDAPVVPQRRDKHAKTTRVQSCELDEKDMSELQNLWQQWKMERLTSPDDEADSPDRPPLDAAVAQVRQALDEQVVELPGQANKEASESKPAGRRLSREGAAKAKSKADGTAGGNKTQRFAGVVPSSNDRRVGA